MENNAPAAVPTAATVPVEKKELQVLLPADLLAVCRPKAEYVELTKAAMKVRLRKFSGRGRDDFLKLIKSEEDVPLSQGQALVASLAIESEDGSLHFDSEAGIKQLQELDAEVLDEIQAHVLRINGLSLVAQEEVAKNSETTQTEPSGFV